MITTCPPSAMIGKAQHAGRMRQRRQREIDRAALEGIAHQRHRRHRLDVAARQHHAFRLAGRAAGAGDHRKIVDRLRARKGCRRAGQPVARTTARSDTSASRQTRSLRSLRQVGPNLLDHRREADGNISRLQSNASRMNWFSAASLRGLIGHQTAPAREMPNTQANAIGSLPERIATFSPGCKPESASPRAMR